LARFYEAADVCLVTPLRDGMNLVAKEFVASQGDQPGVLVLSKFSGAASSLTQALLVNPYDIEGVAEATYRALRMPLEERRTRWRAMMDDVCDQTAQRWSDEFWADLAIA
jgi:trehalose 6-phosphate synthase